MSTVPLRTAADALRYYEMKQHAVSNNLANAETPGFKAERVFAHLLDQSLRAGERTDLGMGALRPTGGPLDLAIEGDGFFVIATPGGERLIRGGAFTLDAEGRITDGSGRLVLGENGPIRIEEGARITIGPDGMVSANEEPVDRLRMESVAGADQLEHESAGAFRATGATAKVANADRHVHQGTLEDSNVSTLESMIDMIEIQRAYASVQGSLRTMDGVLETIANQIGRVG